MEIVALKKAQVCVLCTVLGLLQLHANASRNRWAILSSPAVQRTGVSDLVSAGISDEFHMVERQSLEQVANELKLTVLSGKATPGDRLKIGQLLSADFLVIFSLDEQKQVRMVISDCVHGARLQVMRVPISKDRFADAKACIDQIRWANKHFEKGITHVVGVSPFISKNLTHDYDYLQNSLACLLQNALSSIPGFAVIEMEEAVAIRREMLIAGSEIRRRVPVLFEADFMVKPGKRRSRDQLSLTIRILTQDDKPTVLHPRPMRFSDALSYLTQGLPKVLISRSQKAPALTRNAQIAWLKKRAAAFALIGAWDESAGLREAALLLSPRDKELRHLLLGSYKRLMQRPLYEVVDKNGKPRSMGSFDDAVRKRVAAYQAGLRHLEYLIRTKRVNAWSAVKLSDSYRSSALLKSVPFFVTAVDGQYVRMGQDLLKPAVESERTFFFRVYPRVLKLPMTQDRSQILEEWKDVLVSSALHRVDRTYSNKEDLDYLSALLMLYTPDFGKSIPRLEAFLRKGPSRVEFGESAFTTEQWLRFLERLRSSTNKMVNVYGRYGLIWENWRRTAERGDRKNMPKLLFLIDQLLKDFEAISTGQRIPDSRKDEALHIELTMLRRTISRHMTNPKLVQAKHTPGPKTRLNPRYNNPSTLFPWNERLPKAVTQKPAVGQGQLKFDPLSIQVLGVDGQLTKLERTRFPHLTRCGNVDVIWSARELCLLQRPRYAIQLAYNLRSDFADVCWDGKDIWIATRRQGIWIASTSGRILHKLPASATPPANRGLLLHPVRIGTVCAVGSFGEHERAWCALVSHDKDKSKVDVFHRATEVMQNGHGSRLGKNPRLVFRPTWTHGYDWGNGPGYLLVGRRNKYGTARYPLMIDLEKRKVWVHARGIGQVTSDALFSAKGKLFVAGRYAVNHWGQEQNCKELCRGNVELSMTLLPLGGKVFVPGKRWHVFDPAVCKSKPLVPGVLPDRYVFQYYAVSAHHGLVAWNETGPIHHVRIQE